MPENADSLYEAVMTKACEKLFKKLPRNQQEWIRDRVREICKHPKQGEKFEDEFMKGLLHTHAGSRVSNVLVIWSVQEKPKKQVIIEGVGSHRMLADMQRRRRAFGIR